MNNMNSSRKSTEALILGAGLTGLSAAYALGDRAIVVEAANESGGTAGTMQHQGFRLDYGVHILYFRDPDTRRWIEEDLQVPLEKTSRRCAVSFGGRSIPFPIQFNLAHLPLVQRLRLGISAIASSFLARENETFHTSTWSERHFGHALTQHFFRPYNEKLWGISIDRLRTEWMEGYVPAPSRLKILRGMCSCRTKECGANAQFWYPRAGGISTLADALAGKCAAINFNKRLASLNLENHVARFQDGDEISYRCLVSTIPLPQLIQAIEPAQPAVLRHAPALRCNPTSFAHVLVPRTGVGDGLHWVYVPDPGIPFYRITLPHNINPANCPEGWSALTLEFGGEISDQAQMQRKSIEALMKMGLMQPSEHQAEVLWDHLDFGYVTYDDDWSKARQTLLPRLREYGVICLGRYGRWEYSNMESALLQGREVYKRLDQRQSASAPNRIDPQTIATPTYRYFSEKYPHRSRSPISRAFRRGESDRLRIVQQWLPHGEGLEILDAGCGDGLFLRSLLQGTASLIRLEDFVPDRVAEARKRLVHKADVVEGVVNDLRRFNDRALYDVVFAFGVFDYDSDWPGLLNRLLQRTRGMLIADFPKLCTLHNALRKCWLQLHSIKLHSSNKASIQNLLDQSATNIEIAESPLHWLVKLQKDNSSDN